MKVNQKSVCLDCSKILAEQEKFYKEIFNLKTDFSGIRIPEANDNIFSWLVCVPENFLTETAFSDGKPQLKIWKFTDKPLDEVMDLSFGRDALKDPRIVRCKANYEVDEDLKNLSANKIAEQNINTLTFKERLLLGRFIYYKENKLLDRETITLCTGSRYLDGGVSRVYWSDDSGKLRVFWVYPGGAFDDLRSRVAVSCI